MFKNARPRTEEPEPHLTPFEQQCLAAQARLRASIDRAGLTGDPYGEVAEAMSGAIDLFPEHIRQVRAASARPVPEINPTVLEKFVKDILAKSYGHWWRDWALLLAMSISFMGIGLAVGLRMH
jgi:hypothetical protein